MCDEWLENVRMGKIASTLSPDIRDVFDSIIHQILLLKMKNFFGIIIPILLALHPIC